MTRVAINGMGRIGRAAMRIILDNPNLELVAVNDLVPVDDLIYLLKYDTVYGRNSHNIENQGGNIAVDGKEIRYCCERDPENLPWKENSIDLVFECTGIFTKREGLEKHIKAGAGRVILSAPTKSADVPMVVHGVNEADPSEKVISTASCTTNCIAPVVEVLSRNFGVKKALMTTIHAYTVSQAIVDTHNSNRRRGRAAALNFVPTSTGAAKATTKVITELEGKFDGLAVRGPVPAGSIVDITLLLERSTSVEELNEVLKRESQSNRYAGILGYSEEQLVSSDILQDTHGSIVDATSTQVVDGDLVKVLSWYDNEWGYASQMVREGERICSLKSEAV